LNENINFIYHSKRRMMKEHKAWLRGSSEVLEKTSGGYWQKERRSFKVCSGSEE
jgi:hypothetical protein